jgi:hypothetical protein
MFGLINGLGATVIVEVLNLLVPAMLEDIAAIIENVLAAVISLFR